MVKKIVKSGNSASITLDLAVLEMLKLRVGDLVSLTVSNDSIILTPTRVGVSEAALRESIKRVRKKYDGALKRLAK